MTIEVVNDYCPAPGRDYDDDYWPTRRAYNGKTSEDDARINVYDGEVWLDKTCEY